MDTTRQELAFAERMREHLLKEIVLMLGGTIRLPLNADIQRDLADLRVEWEHSENGDTIVLVRGRKG